MNNDEKRKEAERLLQEACKWERVLQKIDNMIFLMHRQKKLEGKQSDPAFLETLNLLEELKAKAEETCDRCWKTAEENRVSLNAGVEDLVVAIYYQAVLDYERACIHGNKKTKREVERFASGSETMTTAVHRARDAANTMREIVRDHGEEIVRWTEAQRKSGIINIRSRKSPYRCPMCGNGLFHVGKPTKGVYRIKCPTCNMEGWWHSGGKAAI